jgi:hypothetical protein
MMPTGFETPWHTQDNGLHCITGKRKAPISHNPALYKKRHKIKNMFGRLKDWLRIHSLENVDNERDADQSSKNPC